MANYGNEITDSNVGGGYGFGGGGMFAMVILLVVVFWVLFRNDGHRDGYGYGGGYGGYPFGGGCGPCVQPTFKDESNFEEERNINSKLCKIDEDVWRNGCKDREATHCEGEKTRDLIRCEAEKEWMYKLNKANTENAMLKSEMFNEKKFDAILGAIGKLDCECVKRPPVWAECQTPNSHDVNCREGFGRHDRDDFGRRERRRCDFDFDCCG